MILPAEPFTFIGNICGNGTRDDLQINFFNEYYMSLVEIGNILIRTRPKIKEKNVDITSDEMINGIPAKPRL